MSRTQVERNLFRLVGRSSGMNSALRVCLLAHVIRLMVPAIASAQADTPAPVGYASSLSENATDSAAVLQSEQPTHIVKMSVEPRGESRPALRHKLLPTY